MYGLSNYPAGVYETDDIFGPKWEQDDHRYCPECSFEVDGISEGYQYESLFFHDTVDGQHCIDITEEVNERPI